MKTVNKEKGFTIIELVVVILLLGILTATALPRFMDVTTEAHTAVNNGVQSALQASVMMFQASYVAKGEPASATVVTPYTSQTNAFGFPVTLAANANLLTAAQCATIYGDLLQAGGRPTVAASATPTAQPLTGEINNTASSDFLAYVLAGSGRVCRYVYTGEARNVGDTAREIRYDSETGIVTLSVTGALAAS